jgi:transposase
VAEEDAKRPHRERDSLVHERTSTINRMKSILIQFGVRNFNPVLRKAREKDPESCAGAREGGREALTGECAGQAIEPRK